MKMIKDTFTLFLRKEECCGCSACFAACPVKAISMVMDKEGFLYPSIIIDKCIMCNTCKKVCPIKNIGYQSTKEIKS